MSKIYQVIKKSKLSKLLTVHFFSIMILPLLITLFALRGPHLLESQTEAVVDDPTTIPPNIPDYVPTSAQQPDSPESPTQSGDLPPQTQEAIDSLTKEPIVTPTREPIVPTSQSDEPEGPTLEPVPTTQTTLTGAESITTLYTIKKICPGDDPNCYTPEQLYSISFSSVSSDLINISVQTRLTDTQSLSFSSLSSLHSIYLYGNGTEISHVNVDISTISTGRINNFVISNTSLTFVTSSSADLYCNSLILNEIKYVISGSFRPSLTNVITIRIPFEMFQYFQNYDSSEIIIEQTNITSVVVNQSYATIQSSSGSIEFSSSSSPITVISSASTITLNITEPIRRIILQTTTENPTIHAEHSTQLFTIIVSNGATLNYQNSAVPVNLTGIGTVSLRLVEPNPALTFSTIRSTGNLRLNVPNEVTSLSTAFEFTGSNPQFNIGTTTSSRKLRAINSITASSLTVLSNTHATFTPSVQITGEITINPGASLTLNGSPSTASSTLTIYYTTSSIQQSPVINSRDNLSISAVAFSLDPSLATSGTTDFRDTIQICKVGQDYQTTFSDDSQHYRMEYNSTTGYLTGIYQNEGPSGDDGDNGSNNTTTIIIVVVVVVVVVIVVIVIVVICIKKKKRDRSSSAN